MHDRSEFRLLIRGIRQGWDIPQAKLEQAERDARVVLADPSSKESLSTMAAKLLEVMADKGRVPWQFQGSSEGYSGSFQ